MGRGYSKLDLDKTSLKNFQYANMFQVKQCWWTAILMVCLVPQLASEQCFGENDRGTEAAPNVGAFFDASTTFAFELFKNVIQSPSDPPTSGNFFISPLSVWAALTITYVGTQKNTKRELGAGLGFGNLNQKRVAELYHHFKDELLHNATENANYTFNLADKIYFDDNIELRQCIVQYLNSELEQLNFHSAPDPSRQTINRWVEDQTNNRIVDLLPSGSIETSTIMVIVNAAYLKAAWAKTFEPRATSEDDFTVEPGHIRRVNMMHLTSRFPFGSSSILNCFALELPYSGNEISLLILLPNSDIQTLISNLNKANLDDLASNMNTRAVNLAFPKFKLQQSLELKGNVNALGVNDLFEAGKADLSGFTGAKNAFVSTIRHKTFLEVTESGTEAAAATAVGISTTAILLPDVEFNVNRPFVMILQNKKHNVVLFVGKINDPTASD